MLPHLQRLDGQECCIYSLLVGSDFCAGTCMYNASVSCNLGSHDGAGTGCGFNLPLGRVPVEPLFAFNSLIIGQEIHFPCSYFVRVFFFFIAAVLHCSGKQAKPITITPLSIALSQSRCCHGYKWPVHSPYVYSWRWSYSDTYNIHIM